MQIEHIFNAVEPKTQKKIASQEFTIGFWKNEEDRAYQSRDSLTTDFSKMYYHALVPSNIEEDSIISKYDDDKLNELTKKLGDDLLLISGDFWGIQKFIFDGVTTSKASKILRSRSAMVQLITYAVVNRIKKEFDGSEALLFGAGKFMILAKNEKHKKTEEIQKELDSYFLENFFGQNGFILSSTTTTKNKLLNQKDMEDDLLDLGADNDDKKLNKFDLLNVEDNVVIHDIFQEAHKDDDVCEFCSKRIKTHRVDDTKACKVCFNEIELGKQLTKKPYVTIFSTSQKESKDNIEIIKLGSLYYYAKFEDEVTVKGDSFDINLKEGYFDYPKWSLNSHVPKDKNNEIITFGNYLKKDNQEDGKIISSGLMALKADIDKLGDTFRELYKKDFRLFNRLSREVEFFFSDYITSLVAQKKNVYTVFAGGDDLFLIGEYKEIIEISKEIRDEFYKFSLEKTTISMGLVMFKPSTPITFVSKMADEAEKRAKAVLKEEDKDKNAKEIAENRLDRNGIDIFGVSMKYDEFIEIEEKFDIVVKYLKDNGVETTSFYYRLIELCDMRESLYRALSKEEKYKDYQFNPNDAMWKSKLNYIIRRNIKRINNDSEIFMMIMELVEEREKFKPSIFLKIYENRENKKEKNND